MDQPLIISIDGPAASGKSSVAKRIASALGIAYVDTGAMYRAATWQMIEAGIDPADTAAVIAECEKGELVFSLVDGLLSIDLAGNDPWPHLKDDSVNGAVSLIARIPEVRAHLVACQRGFAENRSLVMEGRDIGTCVFPDCPHKFYIDAPAEVRAARRRAEGIEDQIVERDRIDSSRKVSPLKVADDAVRIDTAEMDLNEVVAAVMGYLASAGVPMPEADGEGKS